MARRSRKGSIYRVAGCANWILSWRSLSGKRQTKSSGSPLKGIASTMLDDILMAGHGGQNVTKAKTKITFGQAAAKLIAKSTLKGLRSVKIMESRVRLHLEPFFGANRLLVAIDDDLLDKFAVHRKAQTIHLAPARWVRASDGDKVFVPEKTKPVANASINRDIATLQSMFILSGVRTDLKFTKLPESQPRQGFFNDVEIARVCEHLPPELKGVVMFGYLSSWRLKEILKLEWSHVDFDGRGRVWLDKGTTKNGEARTLKMTGAIRELLAERRVEHERLKALGRIVPAVFTREKFTKQADGTWQKEDGQPIRSFIKTWKSACKAAGCPGRLFHDLRRSAIRNFVRAGVSQSVAMKMSGHLTPSVFTRYDIIADMDLDDAADKMDRAASTPIKPVEKHTARVRPFKRRTA